MTRGGPARCYDSYVGTSGEFQIGRTCHADEEGNDSGRGAGDHIAGAGVRAAGGGTRVQPRGTRTTAKGKKYKAQTPPTQAQPYCPYGKKADGTCWVRCRYTICL